ncbi:hypothetical protein KEU06_20590 [Pseudaminobacter sp. 19-2017]|uniref:CBS domain-containing protein n=1 Tax=Pseudaminobacter soli (ex Zhang et al. 2022) TaxID=2831468 RepID=A0A942E9N6_9HYPH|nr:hypothetical protein [Pseudaminobacter soli]MBS3651012.1 hypothetical protein [Pseudaminobacter soli]
MALFDEQSRFVGAIGIRDVLSAVLRRVAATSCSDVPFEAEKTRVGLM